MNAAYQASPEDVGVSLKVLYDRLAEIQADIQTLAAFLRDLAARADLRRVSKKPARPPETQTPPCIRFAKAKHIARLFANEKKRK